MLIAAHAVGPGATLVINDYKEFERVPSLQIETWV